jgi:hypothetical protein
MVHNRETGRKWITMPKGLHLAAALSVTIATTTKYNKWDRANMLFSAICTVISRNAFVHYMD